jgi:hypothetical protein
MVLNGEPGWICLMCCNIDSESPFFDHPPRSSLIKINLPSIVQRPRPPLDNLQRQRLHRLVPKRRANPLNPTHPLPKAPRPPAPSFRDRRLRARAARMAEGNRCHDRRVCERTRRRVGVGQNKYHSSECGHHRDGTY